MKLSAVPVQPASTVEAGGNPALHGQWLFVEYEWAMRFGQGMRPRFAEMIELDLTLRQMEQERMRVKWAQRRDLRPADDLLLTISERWILLSHDLLRAARTAAMRRQQPLPARVRDLSARLDLLRPVLMERAPVPPGAPFWRSLAAGTETAAESPPHRLVPCAVCECTGSVVWWPVVSSRTMTVDIRRRGLSDGFLSAFE